MDDGYSPQSLLILVIIIGITAIFYGFEKALKTMNRPAMEKKTQEGNKKAGKILHIADEPESFVFTRYCYGLLTGILLSMYSFLLVGWEEIWKSILSVVVLLLLFLVFGVAFPVRLAARKPENWALRWLFVIQAIYTLLWPFTCVAMLLSRLLLKLFGVDLKTVEDNVTEEGIMSMVDEGHEQGVIEASEAEMIHNIIELGDKKAGDIMTHRNNIVALDGEMTLKEAVESILQENKSRFPVYLDDLDNIIGVLYFKDVILFSKHRNLENRPVRSIKGLLRKASFIPETRDVDRLFRDMQSKKIHMSIVVDEYGQTIGLITMEDILEEIVGNILDEYDEEEELIQENADGTFIMNGMAQLEDISGILDILFDEDEVDTLNGLLIRQLGHIPGEREKPQITYKGYVFSVLHMDNKRIHTVKVERLPQQEEPLAESV